MDALPVTLGDEFLAYASAITRAAGRIRERRDGLLEVAIGGTATGTGANAPAGIPGRGDQQPPLPHRASTLSRHGTVSRHSRAGRRWSHSPVPSANWRSN